MNYTLFLSKKRGKGIMSDISVEQKLLLLRSIREAEDKNRMNLRQHENLLYGAGRQNEMTEPVYGTQDVPARHFFMGVRIFAAIVLFSLYVIFSFTGDSIFFLNTKKIDRLLGANYQLDAIDNIEEFLYNK